MRKAVGEQLEIIVEDSWSPPPSQVGAGRRSRRVQIGVVVGLVVLAWVAFPFRAGQTRRDVVSMGKLWAEATALDVERDQLQSELLSAAAGTDIPLLLATYAALDRQEAGELGDLQARVPGAWSLDGGTRRLHRVLVAALQAERRDTDGAARTWLSGATPFELWTASTVHAVSVAAALLQARLASLGVAAQPAPIPPRFDAATAALKIFARSSDRPLPVRVLVARGAGLATFDLASGRSALDAGNSLGPSFTPDVLLARQGFAVGVDQSGERAAIIPDGRPGTALIPIPGVVVLVTPAARPDTFWVVRADVATVEELDGTGRTVAGPVTLPAGSALAGAVPAGLVLDANYGEPDAAITPIPGIEVWDPVTGSAVSTISAGSDVFVMWVEGNTIAWADSSFKLQLSSPQTGRTVTAALRLAGSVGPEAGTLTPDGRHFVGWFDGSAPRSGEVLGDVDVATGNVRVLARGGAGTGLGLGTGLEKTTTIGVSSNSRYVVALDGNGSGSAIDLTTGQTDSLRVGRITSRTLVVSPSQL